MDEFTTGCLLEPMTASPVSAVLGSAIDVPKAFIVPVLADNFTIDPKTGEIQCKGVYTPRDQKNKPSCVGQSVATQKSHMEGVQLSARDLYAQAKQIDGFGGPLTWGTSFSAAYSVLETDGVADELERPEPPREMSLEEYVKVTPAVRTKNKNKNHYFVPRTEIAATVFQTKLPVVTSLMWYSNDNSIGSDGLMHMPSGSECGGHAVACIGFGLRDGVQVLVFQNSWGLRFGDHGFFYVPTKDVLNRFGNGYVSIDADSKLPSILVKFNGLDVKAPGSPDVFRISNGAKHKYANEVVFWTFGNLFGFDIADIKPEDLAVIPEGPEMDIKDAPFKTKELVRQLRQFYKIK